MFLLVGQVPYVGINFAVYESLKDWLVKAFRPFGLVEDSDLSVTYKASLWGCCWVRPSAKLLLYFLFLDVIRRRNGMQSVGWKDAASIVTGDGRGKAPPLEYNGIDWKHIQEDCSA
ncbi:hypothetical protein NC651_031945 [Populus alba x Populus x berolinensis]|nr:hypothetical protein NC651_031945 [Populus alba x Populus x berolinensis]